VPGHPSDHADLDLAVAGEAGLEVTCLKGGGSARLVGLPEAMPLLLSPACPLSRTRLEANRPHRDRQSVRAPRKVRKRVAESAAPLGSGRSARPISVRVLMAFSRSGLGGDLPFFPVVQSAALVCRLWCVSVPYPQLDTNLMPKRGCTVRH